MQHTLKMKKSKQSCKNQFYFLFYQKYANRRRPWKTYRDFLFDWDSIFFFLVRKVFLHRCWLVYKWRQVFRRKAKKKFPSTTISSWNVNNADAANLPAPIWNRRGTHDEESYNQRFFACWSAVESPGHNKNTIKVTRVLGGYSSRMQPPAKLQQLNVVQPGLQAAQGERENSLNDTSSLTPLILESLRFALKRM